MRTYRDHLRRLNDRRAEGYIGQNGQHVVVAIQELAQAAPVTLAIRQLHEAIRSSSARNFWPVIRQTKGVLFVRPTDTGLHCPWPWRRTTTGNMRYGLPGYLLFCRGPNVRRRVRNRTIELQRVIDQIQARPGIGDFLIGNLLTPSGTRRCKPDGSLTRSERSRGLRCRTALRLWTDGQMNHGEVRILCYGSRTEHLSITTAPIIAKLKFPTRSPSLFASPQRPIARWNCIWSEPERDPITPERRSVSGPPATSSDVRYWVAVGGQADIRRATGHDQPFYGYTA